jgi:hypothetical protein
LGDTVEGGCLLSVGNRLGASFESRDLSRAWSPNSEVPGLGSAYGRRRAPFLCRDGEGDETGTREDGLESKVGGAIVRTRPPERVRAARVKMEKK